LPITINFWMSGHPIPHFLDPAKEAAAAFNRAHPEYDVRIREVPFRDLPREVVLAVEEGDPPELADYYSTSAQLALDTRDKDGRPLFTPIQRAIGGRTTILGEPVVVDDVVPAVRDYYSQAGELVALPTIVSTAILFANKDMLARAGVGDVPRTWAGLEAACAAVRRLPDGPAHGVAWPNHGWMFQMEVAAQGGLLADNDNGHGGRATKVTLDSPEMLDYVRWWQRMHESGDYLYTGTPRDWMAGMEAFQRGEVAFVVSSSAVGPMMTGMAAQGGFELALGVLPDNDAVPYAGRLLGGQATFLAAGLPKDREDGALAFLQYLLNPANAVRSQQQAGSVPVTTPAHDEGVASGWYDEHPYYRVAAEQVTSSNRTPAAAGAMMGDLSGIQDLLTAAMDDVLLRGADPAARLHTASGEAQALLDRYNAATQATPPVTPDALEAG
jgi:sn-glycerol 3-phosphate transport system substrate-binding protein